MLLRVVALLSLVTNAIAADDFPLVSAQECRPRAGLPNFIAKASTAGSELKVAYLGGSITAQPGWRVKSLKLLGEQFPQAKFSEIHAAIGGTGSDLGVFRVQQDVLVQKPDLMFVEFAVNDGGAAPDQIQRCMEGIVRQTWRALPTCDICFVYTITEALVGPMLEGKFPRAASAMESVADHYGIPTIHMGMEVARLAKEKKLAWKAPLPKAGEPKSDLFVFAADSVHPHVETGHELYREAIARSLPSIREASKTATPHTLIAPLKADNYEHAKLLPISSATLSAGFRALDPAKDSLAKTFSRLKALHEATKPGETLSFKFKGTRASIYHVVGPLVGQVTIQLDDDKPRTQSLFDPYCTYNRLNTMLIGSNLADTEHRVTITIDSKQPDKAKLLAVRKDKMDKPERFDGTAFYPGALLLVGELIKP